MSEQIRNHNDRYQRLLEFSRYLIQTGNAKAIYADYQSLTDTVTDRETMQLLDQLLQEEIPFEQVKSNLGKLLNVFHKSLKGHSWERPGKGHFLYYLMQENRAVEARLAEIKALIKPGSGGVAKNRLALQGLIGSLESYELHYIKKENILFPSIEKVFPQYRCLQLMWSFHDDFRWLLKRLNGLLEQQEIDEAVFNKALGDLFFVVLPVIFREEQILYPVAYQAIPEKGWHEMLRQSEEVGWCYIESPDYRRLEADEPAMTDGLVDLGTGQLSPAQLMLMLEHLPVDITFVDENDEVRYFSGAKHRIFPRSNAIIGRKVQNCHPKESVHVVNEIVAAFRDGSRDQAEFWIQMKGRFIHIRYYALRDGAGTYKGTIEVSQDVTGIRGLQGERRLLDWR